MRVIRGVFLLIASLFALDLTEIVGAGKAAVTKNHEDLCRGDIDEDAPAYDCVVPMVGWMRYCGDTARSIREWGRWWKYLRMKKPIIMKWTNNLILRIHPNNEVFRALFVRGIYDPNLAVVINTLLSEGGVFLDVGANMGYISLLAGKVVGAKGHVYALEPCSRDFTRLLDNINLNDFSGIVSARQLAVSDKSGEEELLIAVEERSSLNTLGSEIPVKGVEAIGMEKVSITTIDEFVKKEKIRKVDVLKLDIEGSELKALEGARKTIAQCRPAIILGHNRSALKACNSDYSELQKTLMEMDYCVYVIVEKPTFVLARALDLSKVDARIVICLDKNVAPPVLPQPKERSIFDSISDFFLR
ncbi:MAG: FkbM family methyltransferase [Holosporaceae bacterium]|nr:FkbM family methyltransferase [Holosporaceae bacterium]